MEGSKLFCEPLMFWWEGPQPCISYIRSKGDLFMETLEYAEWYLTRSGEWELDTRLPFENTRDLKTIISTETHLCAAANALIAINAEYVLSTPREKGVVGRVRRGRTPSENVRVIDLDETGLVTWARKYISLREDSDPAPTRGKQTGPRNPPRLHTVDPGMCIRWVLKPDPGEEVLAVRESKYVKQDGKRSLLHAVARPRAGFIRGEEQGHTKERMSIGSVRKR